MLVCICTHGPTQRKRSPTQPTRANSFVPAWLRFTSTAAPVGPRLLNRYISPYIHFCSSDSRTFIKFCDVTYNTTLQEIIADIRWFAQCIGMAGLQGAPVDLDLSAVGFFFFNSACRSILMEVWWLERLSSFARCNRHSYSSTCSQGVAELSLCHTPFRFSAVSNYAEAQQHDWKIFSVMWCTHFWPRYYLWPNVLIIKKLRWWFIQTRKI